MEARERTGTSWRIIGVLCTKRLTAKLNVVSRLRSLSTPSCAPGLVSGSLNVVSDPRRSDTARCLHKKHGSPGPLAMLTVIAERSFCKTGRRLMVLQPSPPCRPPPPSSSFCPMHPPPRVLWWAYCHGNRWCWVRRRRTMADRRNRSNRMVGDGMVMSLPA